MDSAYIAKQRIVNQQLAGTKFKSPGEVVSWMGAMQAQDYAMAKWAVGVRLLDSTEQSVEQAINSGEIIRTHVMRPTWHFVSSQDVNWMLKLTAPHLRKSMIGRHKAMGLTDQLFKKTNSIIEKSLAGKKFLTRPELVSELSKNKIKPDSLQMIHIMFNAEVNGTVCNGPMRGKQFTYALLEERVPKAKSLTKNEALEELSKRYFTSHGPATAQDFKWWSGLPSAEVKTAMEMVKLNFTNEKVGGQVYWFDNSCISNPDVKPIYFLPAYDEFMISYKDRSVSLETKFFSSAITSNGIFKPMIVVDGKVVGTWSRGIKKDQLIFEPAFFRSTNKLKKKEMMAAFASYKKFHITEIKLNS